MRPSSLWRVERTNERCRIIIGPNSASCVRTLAAEDVVDQRTNVERLPVVVIRGFAAKGETKQEILWEALADWAAVLVENRVRRLALELGYRL